MKKAALIIAIIAIASSCCTKKVTTETEHIETRTTLLRDTIIRPVNLQTSLSISDIKRFPVDRWITIEDTAARGEVRFLLDSLGDLHVLCVGKDHVINQLRHENYILKNSQKTEILQTENFWSRMGNLIQWGIVALLALAIIGFAWRFLWPLFRRH